MPIHIGLIGGGNISETHARAARAIADAKLVAIYGQNPQKVARLCREYDATPFSDFDAFLAHRPMEMVAIGSPSGMHAAHGIAAARCGLHVMTEKPIEITTGRTDELIQAAERAGIKLGVFFQDRVKQDIRKLKEWLDEGRLGMPILIDARVKWYRPPEYYSDSRWRGTFALDGGGALINQGVHTLDLLLWLLGDVVRVQAVKATALHSIEAEDTVVATLEFASGAIGVLQASTAAYPGYPRRVEISGSEGTIILEHDRIVAAHLRMPVPGLAADAAPDLNESASSPVVGDFRGHQALLEDFIRAIRQNGKPLCDGHEGRSSIALVEEIYRSAEESSANAKGVTGPFRGI